MIRFIKAYIAYMTGVGESFWAASDELDNALGEITVDVMAYR